MRDYENKLLAQYCIDVIGSRKMRGGFLCDTKQGVLRLKELSSSEKKIPYVDYIYKQLSETGFSTVDYIIPDAQGSTVCGVQDYGNYILTKWFIGRECDVYKEKEVLEATKTLARLHNSLDVVSEQITEMQKQLLYDNRWEYFQNQSLVVKWKRHNKGLNKVRGYIRSKVHKGRFEHIYLERFNEVYTIAEEVVKRLEKSEYYLLYEYALKHNQLIHGDYNHHNVLFVGNQVAVTNFEHFRIDIPIADFYYFLRKVMEKRSWDEKVGRKMLNAYCEIREISKQEKEYLALRLMYPEKFWKITNYYYNTNKAWISEKNVEKLIISINQMEIKREFVQHIFSFHL